MTAGLLWVLSEPGEVDDTEFHDWYDNEHVPLRLAIPGLHTARRLRAADSARPGWSAIYDVDLEALDRPDYVALREHRSAREQHVVDRLAALDRRTYLLESDAGAAPAEPALVVTTSLTVPTELESELAAWYSEEHTPALLGLPGWDRVRRYRLLTGTAPVWLAVHELSDAAALDHPGYREAVSTPRRAPLMAAVAHRERRVWALHRDF